MGGGAVAGAAGGRAAEYTGGMTWYVLVVALIGGSSGASFGMDNGIAGGVVSMPAFKDQFFPAAEGPGSAPEADQSAASPYCKHNDATVSLFVSSLFLAGIVGALVASTTSRKFGRRNTMLAGGVAFAAGAALMACAVHVAMLIAGRMAMGLGVGLTTQAAPLFLSEMAPYKLRGALNILFQLAVAVGILVAQLINYGTQYIPVWGWRLSLALSGSPAALLIVGCLFLPDTPDSLVVRGREAEAEKVLRRIRGAPDVRAELEDIRDAAAAAKRSGNQWRTIMRPAYRPQLALALALPVFQQLTGINSVIFYAPQLFSSMGAGSEAALLAAVVIGATGVLTTLVSLALVDRLGRKALFLEGGLQMIAAEVAIGALLGTQFSASASSASLPPASAAAVIALVCLYVAGFAWSWGPLTWLVCTEVQPLETRSAGYAISVVANFAATFVVGQAFLPMLCGLQYGIFFFFAGFVVVATAFVVVLVPETKGVPMDEIQRELFLPHRVWGPVVRKHWPAADADDDAGADAEQEVAKSLAA